MGVNLSVLILAKNEEKNIEACIRSALFADEVLVIDDMSSDRTKEIAESLGAKVLQRALNGNWGEQQTFAMQNAQCDWIYCLDADERISHRLAEEISRVVAEDDRRYAYQTARLNYFWEQPLKHGGWFPDHGIRLLPRKGVYVTGFVHPQFHYDGYELKNLPDDAYVIHYPYRDWEHYFNKLNFYTTLVAKKNREKGKRASFMDIIAHPAWASFRMYIVKGGWRDGKIGFVLAVFHYFYTMAKYVKLYYLERTNEHVGDED